MNLRGSFVNSKVGFVPTALLVIAGITTGCGQSSPQQGSVDFAQQRSVKGIVDDWSTHHVKFSNPGTEVEALREARHQQWLRITTDPRYQMQLIRRSAAWVNRFADPALLPRDPREPRRPAPIFGKIADHSLQRDWAYSVAPTGYGSAFDTYPAKYSFDINAAPSCSDFVVYPVDTGGSSSQANLVGFNNLYDGTCPSSAGSGSPFAPTVMFAYFVDAGSVTTSPVLSRDGAKLAFVAGTDFHILTLGTTGNNGSLYNAPVQPCTINGIASCSTNNAVDINIAMSGSTADSISSPFVDYINDVAYVGDNNGNLHKFTGVFNGTPTEVTSGGWPFTVAGSAYLSSPTLDSVSGHIFISDFGDGNLYCIDVSSGTPVICSPTASIVVGTELLDGPIVDSTAQTVFASAGDYYNGSSYESALTQATTSLANVVTVDMGPAGQIYNGDFDNTYYSSSAGGYSGYMYFCGSAAAEDFTPTLYRVGFNSSGTMNSTNDGNSYPLATFRSYCTPLTEVYNTTQSTDYMFLGVILNGSPTGCGGAACVMSFDLGSSFPSAPSATYPLGGNNDSYGSSGIIIDNVSSQAGASQIYFSNLEDGNATQASQNGLN